MKRKTGNILVVILAIVAVLSLLVVFYFFQKNLILKNNNSLQQTKVQSIPQTPTQKYHDYFYSNKLINQKETIFFEEIVPENKTTNLTDKGIVPSNNMGERIVTSGNKQITFFSKEGNIYSATPDGENIKKLTSFSTFTPPYNLQIDGADFEGNQIIFEITNIPGMIEQPINPKISYGLYYFKLDQQPRLLRPGLDSLLPSFNFRGFVNGLPTYISSKDHKLYTLNLQNGDFIPHPDIKITLNGDLNDVFVDILNHLVIYSWHVSYPEPGKSQILITNYQTGKTTEVTPVGNFAEYQGVRISPDFQNFIYVHQSLPSQTDGKVTSEYFVYNIANKKAKSLLVNSFSPPFWVNNNTVVYDDNAKQKGIGNPTDIISLNIFTDQKEIVTQNSSLIYLGPPVNSN